jgi:hypothetical protein
MKKRLWLPLVLGLLGSLSTAQNVGSKLGPVELVDFAQTEAGSFDDFLGRAVLIEFFAYW